MARAGTVRLTRPGWIGATAVILSVLCPWAPDPSAGRQPVPPAAAAAPPYQFVVDAAEGRGIVRYFGTASLDAPDPLPPRAVRAIVNIHGALRDAGAYERAAEAALQAGGLLNDTVLVTPQFATAADALRTPVSPGTLRWTAGGWVDGSPAVGPAPLSTFAVLDAIGQRLGDRARFPALREIVFLGHSAGGQLVQRYAVVGRLGGGIPLPGLGVRYVVADPSSYLYFDAARPRGDTFAPYDATACPGYNRWKYGPEAPPPYVTAPVAQLEARYVTRRVTYLLGQRDTDPDDPLLDTSCAGTAEGPHRLARGRAYVRYLRLRHPEGTRQDVAEVAGVAHHAGQLYASPCGIAVIADRGRAACARAFPI